jgi:hypothetical protein
MATGSVIKLENKKFEARNAELRRMVDSIVVRDAETCALAKRGQKDLRDEMKARKLVLDPFVFQAKTAYEAARDERDRWIKPLQDDDDALAVKVRSWEREERERAEQEQRREQEKIRLETERKAREERMRLEAIAEEERKARQKEIEAARKAGELKAAVARALQKKAEAEALLLKAQAKQEEKIAAANVPVVEVKANIPVQSGVPSRINWRYRIVNASLIPDEYWTLDEQKIGAEVRRLKEKTDIPGLEAYPD